MASHISYEELRSGSEPTNQLVYTMYHGTTVAKARLIIANGFRQSSDGMLGRGVYVSRDQDKAAVYPKKVAKDDRVVLKLRVYVGKVKCINKKHDPLRKCWNEKEYDTAWVPPNCGMEGVPSGMEEDCVFDPKRVEVKGIVHHSAPNTAILTELQTLIKHYRIRPWKGDYEFLSANIKTVDMPVNMQQNAVDCATQAMEKYNIQKDIAAYIKKEFDKKYTPTWHCIVGKQFGSYVTHEYFIYFHLEPMFILLFKC